MYGFFYYQTVTTNYTSGTMPNHTIAMTADGGLVDAPPMDTDAAIAEVERILAESQPTDTEPATPDPAPVEGTPPDADDAPEPKNDVVPAPTASEEDQP